MTKVKWGQSKEYQPPTQQVSDEDRERQFHVYGRAQSGAPRNGIADGERAGRHGMAGLAEFITGDIERFTLPTRNTRLGRIIAESVADMEESERQRNARREPPNVLGEVRRIIQEEELQRFNEEYRRVMRERSPGFEGGDIVPLNVEDLRNVHPHTSDYVTINGRRVHESEVTTHQLYEEYRRMIEGARHNAQPT